MRCPRCQAELPEDARYCSGCGHELASEVSAPPSASGVRSSALENVSTGADQDALRPPSGFSRTLSTDLVARQIELRTLAKLSALVQSRTYQPGEVMIHKGEMKRDLFLLTEGRVEISRKEGEGELVLNEIEPPYILGEIAFLFGMSRTATATAKTQAKAFVLRYEDLQELLKGLPEWLTPLLTSLASGIKSLHLRAKQLETMLSEAEKQSRQEH